MGFWGNIIFGEEYSTLWMPRINTALEARWQWQSAAKSNTTVHYFCCFRCVISPL